MQETLTGVGLNRDVTSTVSTVRSTALISAGRDGGGSGRAVYCACAARGSGLLDAWTRWSSSCVTVDQSILESGCAQSCTHLLQRHFTLLQCMCHCHGRTWARANRVALHCSAATASAPVVWSHQHYCTDGLTVGGSIPKPRSPEPVFFLFWQHHTTDIQFI